MTRGYALLLLAIFATGPLFAFEEPPRMPDARMAGWHRTMVTTHETVPNTTVKTYLTESMTAVLSNVLVKFAPSVNGAGAEQAEDITVEDFPGGVTARFTLDGVRVTTEIVPLFYGRGKEEYEGAALYRVLTEPATPVTVGIGGPGEQHMSYTQDILKDTLVPLELVNVRENTADFLAGREKLNAGVRASAPLGRVAVEGGEALSATFDSGAGEVLLVYAHDMGERVAELRSLDTNRAREQVDTYYAKLLSQYVDTPEDAIDQAWRAALYNLEYNWNEPYGWNECIHHWLAMWHNQHTAGAEWTGQEDRSRTCTVTLAENLLPSGAVPHFTMDGSRRRDFGGSNHIWAWQARHYWQFTADQEFAAVAAPALDRILAQTFEEHDPDHNLLVAWGLQIGNQEDFIQFYNDGGTPSIEVINMMRTRAELAEGLGDVDTARLWRGRAGTARGRLLEKLWLRDLGRLGHYIDEHGKVRLDAQYHTYLYPTLWDIVDERDGYTSLRHVRDALTGADGEVYCSNNFPNHDNGTWGMQAGAAQQPWAAWAYSKAGMRNEAYRPLLAIARYVMNRNLRGAWPEVMREHTPAYFTPPAGLFVAAVVEALFGLRVDKPAGVLDVAPCFPDHWPEASMKLDKFSAEYARDGNTWTYSVGSADALARKLRWSIPPARDIRLRIDGESAAFTATPGVERMVVAAETPAATRTTFELSFTPIDYALTHDGSIAEGDALHVTAGGAEMVSVDDRCGVLAQTTLTGDRLDARIAGGLLTPYLPYGRLGRITFSRRTFFVECAADDVRFWAPVDITVLPRFEAAPKSEVVQNGERLTVSLLLRNNTARTVEGTAWLRAARHDFPFELRLSARSEETFEVAMPLQVAALLSVGDNNASITLPSGESLECPLSTRALYEDGPLRDYMTARLTPVPLPEEDLADYQGWTELREGSHGGPVPWPGWADPMGGIEEQTVFEHEALPAVRFEVIPKRWVLVGERIGKPYYRLDLHDGLYKKFYLLVATFADNHDIFTQLGRVTVRGAHQVIRARAMHFPGDLDWWERHGMADTMDTARFGRPDRFGLLPLLAAEHAHWRKAPPPELPTHPGHVFGPYDIAPAWIPPSFPQPEYWADCRVLQAPNCTFNIVEIDLGQPMDATSLALETTGICPGFALYGVVAERAGGVEALHGTPWLPPAAFREPTMVFSIHGPEDLDGWTLEGAAYGAAVGVPSLNTLAPAGESATGRAVSPAFTLPQGATELHVEMHGGHNHAQGGADNLVLRLRDAGTEEVLGVLEPPGTHAMTTQMLDVDGLQGRTVRLELFDNNTAPSYAWIGLRSVSIIRGGE